jgi:FkbM family methyltransferase
MNMMLANLLVKPAVKFYKRRILKDPFQLAIRQWKRDRANHTLRYKYPLDENSTVLDVGGYRGDFAEEMVNRFGCKVIVFEPMPSFYEHCSVRFKDQPKVTVMNYGLGSCDETLQLSESDDASSFHRTNVASKFVEARLRDAETVWAELGLADVDLIKVNIEGGEYPLLPHLIHSGLIERIKHVQVQFHDFVEDAPSRRNEIRSQLANTHDEQWCYTFVWESWKRKASE